MKAEERTFQFCFTLDTEPDNLWEYRSTCSFESFARLLSLHRRLTEAGARPTYLTTSEVAESPLGRSAMQKCLEAGPCEIGAHYHTWTREWPFEIPNFRKSLVAAMAHQLPERVEDAMLAHTCASIRQAFSIEPTSFRGGRWSLGSSTPQLLVRHGILVDSTMTPGLSWRDNSGGLTDGCDFRESPMMPHYLTAAGADVKGLLLELPVGTAPFPFFARHLYRNRAARMIAGGIGKRMGVKLGYQWLRPTDTSVENMRAVMTSLIRRRCSVWVFMIHSSEIIPCKPLPSERHVAAMIERCEAGIRVATELGAKPATLTEAALLLQREGVPECTMSDISLKIHGVSSKKRQTNE